MGLEGVDENLTSAHGGFLQLTSADKVGEGGGKNSQTFADIICEQSLTVEPTIPGCLEELLSSINSIATDLTID